jgi:hypothetical protein
MELILGDTRLKCYEDGRIERFHKYHKKWTHVKGTNNKGYLRLDVEGKGYYYHRIIYKAFHPEFDLNSLLDIDHVNRDKKDNQIENLRAITHQQNSFNTNAKGYRQDRNRFQALIMINGTSLSKCFATEDEARTWYLEQKEIHHTI